MNEEEEEGLIVIGYGICATLTRPFDSTKLSSRRQCVLAYWHSYVVSIHNYIMN